ncbi:MAG TPA: hypothetical protein VFZ66_27015 [Herpetosiphonaceae bacterium]
MSTRIVTLRQRAVQLLGALRQLSLLAEQPPEIAPALLANAPQLFKLAHIAVGDADSAALLAADVLAQAPANEGTALRMLVERVPQGWLSWPGAAGPSEWLSLGIRREQADRLLSVLGEWDAQERIALALYLLWDVRRDDLDSWLGTSGMAECVGELIGYVGEGLNIVVPGGRSEECAEIAPDLLEAHDPQIGRAIRLHLIGCDACRRRIGGLRRTAELLRKALHIFFRAPLPANFDQIVQQHRHQRQPLALAYWKPALAATLLLVALGWWQRAEPQAAALIQPPPRAAELLDRALNRFARQPAQTGVLHERVRVGSGDTTMLLERWYDYRSPQRLRVTVRKPNQAKPVFDLATDGSSWIAYEVDNGFSRPISTLVRNPEIATLMPLLRQLPFVGTFSETPIEQESMDLALLAQAQRGKPTLLGTTQWRGRSAYMLSSVAEGVGRVILTIDRETLSVLEARVAPDVDGAASIRRVWEAETVEVLTREELPPYTFELGTRTTVVSQIDPRQFVIYPVTNLDPSVAVRYSSLPVPEYLPDPTLIAHLRGLNGINAAILQVYEGEWSTLAIVTPRTALRPVPWDRLDHEFTDGRYTIRPFELPQATMAWFVMDDAPYQVMQLYFWHALADDTEREQMVQQILDSLVLVDEHNVGMYRQRFPVESPVGKAGTLSLPQARLRAVPVPPGQAAQRRYYRSKLEQAYEPDPRPQSLGLLVR